MGKSITQRELRNDSGAILRAVDDGESFTITRNGRPVAELVPIKKPHFITREALFAALGHLPPIDYAKMRDEIDAVIDQDPTPRG